MAPEILRGEKYETASDVYSFGVVLLELFTGKIPHHGLSLPQITGLVGYNENHKLDLPEDIPHPLLRSLIEKCTKRNPKDRPTFDHILDEITENKDKIIRDGRKPDLTPVHLLQNLKAFYKAH